MTVQEAMEIALNIPRTQRAIAAALIKAEIELITAIQGEIYAIGQEGHEMETQIGDIDAALTDIQCGCNAALAELEAPNVR